MQLKDQNMIIKTLINHVQDKDNLAKDLVQRGITPQGMNYLQQEVYQPHFESSDKNLALNVSEQNVYTNEERLLNNILHSPGQRLTTEADKDNTGICGLSAIDGNNNFQDTQAIYNWKIIEECNESSNGSTSNMLKDIGSLQSSMLSQNVILSPFKMKLAKKARYLRKMNSANLDRIKTTSRSPPPSRNKSILRSNSLDSPNKKELVKDTTTSSSYSYKSKSKEEEEIHHINSEREYNAMNWRDQFSKTTIEGVQMVWMEALEANKDKKSIAPSLMQSQINEANNHADNSPAVTQDQANLNNNNILNLSDTTQ